MFQKENAQNVNSQMKNGYFFVKNLFESYNLFYGYLFKITLQLALANCDHGVVGLNPSSLWSEKLLIIPIELFVLLLIEF
jgi:hypothetical protein